MPGDEPTRGLDAAYDAAGGLHITYIAHSRQQNGQSVIYAYCAPGQDCDKPANWTRTVVATGAFGGTQIEATADGRPRLLYEPEYTLTHANFVYAECNTNCIAAANWGSVRLTTEPVQLVSAFTNETTRRDWFALDPQGRPRLLTPMHGVAYYGLCDADCLQLRQWTFTEIRVKPGDFDTRTLGWPVLRFGPDGRAHVLAQNVFQLVYLTCPDGCALASNWEITFLSGAYNAVTPRELDLHAYEWDLEVSTDGHVMLGASGNRLTNPNMLAFAIWACAANCGALANWDGFYVNNNAGSGLDVVSDRRGLPAITFSGKRTTDGMGITAIARCIKPNECYSSDANWSTQVVDTHAAMEAELPVGPFLPPVCGIGTLEWYPTAGRLLFDGANALRLFATGTAAAICRGNPQDYLDQWGTWRQRRDTDVWTFLYKARLVIVPAR